MYKYNIYKTVIFFIICRFYFSRGTSIKKKHSLLDNKNYKIINVDRKTVSGAIKFDVGRKRFV